MIERIITWSTHNRFFVWIGILLIVAGGVWSVLKMLTEKSPLIVYKFGARTFKAVIILWA